MVDDTRFPHSEEAERVILAAILSDPARMVVYMALTLARLSAADFFVERHRRIFELLSELCAVEGLSSLLPSLCEDSPVLKTSIPRLETNVEIVKERSVRRRLKAASAEIIRDCLGGVDPTAPRPSDTRPRYYAERRTETLPVVEWVVLDRRAPLGERVLCAVPQGEHAEARAAHLVELLNLDDAGNVLRDWTVVLTVDGKEAGSFAAEHASPHAADVADLYWTMEAEDYRAAGASPVLQVEVYPQHPGRGRAAKPLASKTARVLPIEPPEAEEV